MDFFRIVYKIVRMRGKDILSLVFVLIIFVLLFISNFLIVGVNNIKKNWPLYRCNPVVMPFAGVFGHDPATNMVYCVQSMQSEYMTYLLEPIHYALSAVESIGSNLMSDMQQIRKLSGNMSSFSIGNFTSVFTKFENIRIEFHRILAKFKDVMGRLLGAMLTFCYVFIGGMDTGQSIINGPIGGAIKAICFHPHNKVQLIDGSIKKMYQVDLNDALKDGTTIEATMRIQPYKNEEMYKLWSNDLNDYIYVTGSHFYKNNHGKWQKVSNHKQAVKCDFDFNSIPYLVCYVTNNGTIPIGEHIFSDWEYDE